MSGSLMLVDFVWPMRGDDEGLPPVVFSVATLGLLGLELSGEWFAPEVPPVVFSVATLGLLGLELSGGLSPLVEASGALVLPMPALSGWFAPEVELSGDFTLPSLTFGGGLAPLVEITGAFLLPSVAFAGGVDPIVELAGALALPKLALGGGVSPSVALGGGLVLPHLALAGSLSPLVEASGALVLPSLQLGGSAAPVVALGGGLVLPTLALGGGVSPFVQLGGAPILPSLQLSGSFDYMPRAVSEGAVTSWLRTAQATVTGLGISSEPDVLNPSLPAVQATDARRPPKGTSANGLPIETYTNDCLLPPQSAANNGTTMWGFATHIAIDDLTANGTILRMGTGTLNEGAANDSLFIQQLGAGQFRAFVQVDAGGANRRSASSAGGKLSSAYVFWLVWFDGTQATEDLRWNMYTEGVKLVLSFGAVGTAAAMPTALRGAPATAGSIMLANGRSDADTSHMIGRFGPNKYFFGSKMAGATVGPLTLAAHNALMNHERPT